jgi:hypothetical protein
MKNVFILLPFASTGLVIHAVYMACFSNPLFIEYFYSRGVYPFLNRFSYFTAPLPFSLAEFLTYLFLGLIAFFVVFIIASVFQPKKKKLSSALFRGTLLLVVLSSMYAFFLMGWSFNYARAPLAGSLGLDVSPADTDELYILCEDLALRANALRTQTLEDESGVFKMNQSKEKINIKVKYVFSEGAPEFMDLGGQTNVKGVLSPNLLSSMNTLGIFIPFTYEPNINMQMPDLFFASSALHEYAHYKGFAREDEANFIAYYVSKDIQDTDFKYSSTMLALNHSLIQLKAKDYFLYSVIYGRLSEAVQRDFENESSYWSAFKESRETSNAINNNYLKSNNQEDGIQSYGRMVDLLIALNRAGEL